MLQVFKFANVQDILLSNGRPFCNSSSLLNNQHQHQHNHADVRPVKDRLGKQDKTCIWVKYRQHKISTLIDTGSDVSIAGEDVARKMGWTIHKHRIKEVSVANSETMSISGAAESGRMQGGIGNSDIAGL